MIPEAERVRLQFLLYYILLELLFPLACFMLLLLLDKAIRAERCQF